MTAPPPADRVQPVAPPPADVPLVQRIAQILAAGYALSKTLDLIAALMAPYRVSRAAVQYALGLAKDAHTPHAVLTANGITPAPSGAHSRAKNSSAELVRTTARNDTFYRAAYIAKASGRMQRSLDEGKSLSDTLSAEQRHFEAHRQARRKRIDAAASTARAADVYGPLLGWYRNPMLDSDIDCRVADGNNFHAWEGTIIGLPGSVHPRCGCSAGPAHEGGSMVNDVLGSVLGRMPRAQAPAQVLKLRRRAS